MPRTAELNYIEAQNREQANIICKACEVPMSSATGAWIGGYCPGCHPAVKALMDLYLSDHRKHYNAIQQSARMEAAWLRTK